MGDTHITGRHIGGGTHITSDMCPGIHISRGYTYHCDRNGFNNGMGTGGIFSDLPLARNSRHALSSLSPLFP